MTIILIDQIIYGHYFNPLIDASFMGHEKAVNMYMIKGILMAF